MRITYSLIALCLILTFQTLNGQTCKVYEREIQEYFMSHEYGEQVNIRLLNSIYRRCNTPTDKMNLIFNYFQAIAALSDEWLSDQEAYETSTYYYDQAAKYFSALSLDERDQFSAQFFERAEGLEVTMAALAYDLGYRRENRYYGEYGQLDNWKKDEIAYNDYEDYPLTRGSSSSRVERTDPQEDFTRGRGGLVGTQEKSYNINGEPYGYVGNLSQINPISYLGYRRKAQPDPWTSELEENTPREELTRSSSNSSANARIGIDAGSLDVLRSVNEDEVYLSAWDLAEVRETPGTASTFMTLQFGEPVARVNENPVSRSNTNFVKIRTRSGRMGWVEASSLVPNGKLAAITRQTVGYERSAAGTTNRQIVSFAGGELVILEQYKNDWVKVISRNGRKEAWLQGIDNLTIEETDIRIAMALYIAMQTQSSSIRQVQLEQIRRMAGFQQSELAPVIYQHIEATYR